MTFSILNWQQLANDSGAIEQLEKIILPEYLKQCRWFGGKARKLSEIWIDKILTLTSINNEHTFFLLILKAKYNSGKSEEYFLPLSFISSSENILEKGIIAQADNGFLIDAIYDAVFRQTIFIHLFNSQKIKQQNGAIFFERGSAFIPETFSAEISSRVLDADQSNSSIIFSREHTSPIGGGREGVGEGADYFLKIYRKLFRETNPDVEVIQFLTEKAHFAHIPSFAGTFYWRKAFGAPITLGMMQQKLTAIKDAWSLAGDYLNEFLISLSADEIIIPQTSIEQATLLGTRTAEMHLALANDFTDASFSPEPFNEEYADWILDNCESLLKRRLRLTKDCYAVLDENGKTMAKFFMSNQHKIKEFFSRIKKLSLKSLRTRIHGDYHLGQILFNGSDYIILDFEGEPESSIKDRKIKHSPLKDVAGILRSFHYAVCAKLYFSTTEHSVAPEKINAAVTRWYNEVTAAFMNEYWKTINNNMVLTAEKEELDFLLQFHLLEKAVYELGYELNSRPTWVKIPMKGIQQVLGTIQSKIEN
ncbi:MAG: hypothetical protein LH473_08280 [Chitinophagales bacterium]|nr:hypothetical protein [Chitinophagales bacterium]